MRPEAYDIQGWVSREVVYRCPKCKTSFRLLGAKEKFCHNCGTPMDWTGLARYLPEATKNKKETLKQINHLTQNERVSS